METMHKIQSIYSKAVVVGDTDRQKECLKLLGESRIRQINYRLEKYGSAKNSLKASLVAS